MTVFGRIPMGTMFGTYKVFTSYNGPTFHFGRHNDSAMNDFYGDRYGHFNFLTG